MTKQRSVLITGASTGIGKAAALHLDKLGFRVFAGVRREADARSIQALASERLVPTLLDVTSEASIAAALKHVSHQAEGALYGLVNNAGVSLNAPLELTPVSDLRAVMEVNVIGLLAVTRAFLPLLRTAQGRLINISSGHGLLAIPDKSVYAASKFAVQAICDSLRVELRPFGISVASVVVGKVHTAVMGKILAHRERILRSADPELVRLYSDLIEFFDAQVKGLPGVPAEQVASLIGRALTVPKPKPRYLVGPGARKMRNLALLPTGLRDHLMYSAIYARRPR